MKDIKRRAFKLDILGGIVLFLLGIVFTWACSPHLFPYFFAKKSNLFETSSSQFKDERWYKCDNNMLLGYYCADKSGRYYLTTTKDGEYMGFYVYNNKTDIADEIVQATYEYMDGRKDSLSSLYLSGKGYLAKMGPEEEGFFTEYFNYNGKTIDDYNVKLYTFRMITPWKALTNDNGKTSLWVWVAIIMILFGIILILNYLTGNYKRVFTDALKKYGILPESLEKDMMFALHEDVAYIGEKYATFATPIGGFVIPYNCLIWAYLEVMKTQHYFYGIKTGVSEEYKLVFWDHNHKKNTVDIKKEEIGNKILDELYTRAPYFIKGYNEKLATFVTDDAFYRDMVKEVDERRNQFFDPQPDVPETKEGDVLRYV
ncbi:MAG: hypothetical protein J5517_08140 [Eubacterium sp.]|nr:hypothetical protein [Eubacterium sp.]